MGTPSIGSGRQVPESVFHPLTHCRLFRSTGGIYGADFGFSNDTAVVFMAHDLDADCVYLPPSIQRPQAEPDSRWRNQGNGWWVDSRRR